MRIQMFLMTALATVPLAAVASPEAGRTDPVRPRVAVLNAVDLPLNLAELRSKLGERLVGAVLQRGYDHVPAARGICTDDECLKALSADGATDVLVVTGGRNDGLGYSITLRLWNASSDREDRSSPECNACSATQMVENVVRAAGLLLDRIPALHASQPSLPISAPVALVPPNVLATAVPHTSGRWTARFAVGLSLIGLGAATAGVGIWTLTLNGDWTGCADQVCSRVYRTSTSGWLLTSGGAVLTGGGLATLLLLPNHPSASVVIGPTGLAIAGRY